MTILLVDDEKAIRTTTRAVLEHAGHTVLEATNGAQALTVFVQNHKDIELIITDQDMPTMTGLELIMGAHTMKPGVKTILSSGRLHGTDMITVMDTARPSMILPKPFMAEVLLQAIAGLFNQST